MKKTIFIAIAFLCLVPFANQAQVKINPVKPADTLNRSDATGLRTGYWEEKTGEILNKGMYSQNKKEGTWVGFYSNTVLSKMESFKDGQKDGYSIQLDRRGKITQFETYLAGVLNGQQVVYAQSGDFPVSETNYLKGVKNGVYRLYYDNGKIQEETYFVQNHKDGASRWFNKNGKAMVEYDYKLGLFEGPQKTFYDNDTLQILSNYSKNQLTGEYKEFYRNGKPKLTGKYVNGQKDGPWTEYDETGKAIKVTKFKAGNPPK